MLVSLSSIRNASLTITVLLSSISGFCEVKMPLLFSDHMVLQRDLPVRVWGWANPGESVSVSFGKNHVDTIAGNAGKWEVALPSMPADSHPQTLVIAGKNTLAFHDVLVGDVWVCAGQSNIERLLREVDYTERDLKAADDSQLRLFRVLSATAVTPQEDLKGWSGRQWMVSNSVDVKDFSAVGFFLGRELRRNLGIPIALVDSTQGGSRVQLWTSVESVEKHADADPEFANWVRQRNELLKAYPQRLLDYPEAKKKYDEKMKEWNNANDADPEYTAKMAVWQAALDKARKEGTEHPSKVTPPTPAPLMPDPPDGGPYSTFMMGNLYNSMIAPLTSFSIKGVIWYQGEANDKAPGQYQVLFPILISDWREKWQEGDFPFLFVQLPNFGSPAKDPVEAKDWWPKLRESQSKALALPNTGMVATIDIGDPWDVHGRDKKDIGIRLSLLARHVVYGEKVVFSGPTYQSMKIKERRVEIRFANHGRGLMIGVPPWTPTGKIPPVPTELRGFAIAGSDRKWFSANAAVQGDRVIVWSDKVTAPVAVRYGWANNPSCNLYNREGLPAPPFRTDDWPL